MIKNDLLLRAARRERTERTPVWLMRQAGRCDPKYRAIREQSDLPLENVFRHADLATEISLLPKRFGVDAIILFQDILTPLAPMGASFQFRPGPRLDAPVRCPRDVDSLKRYDPSDKLGFVTKAIQLVQEALNGELPLLGFAGAPLTLAFFLIEGRSPGSDPRHVRAMMQEEPAVFHRLLDRLTDMTVDYLTLQIEAGVDAVQLFESLASALTQSEYEEFAQPYHVKIFSELSDRVPRILFAKEFPDVELMVASGADVLSVGSCVDLADAKRRFGHRVAFQGNVDNQVVATGTFERIDQAVRECVAAGDHEGHILNLDHGLLQDTPLRNVTRMIDTNATLTFHRDAETVVGR